MSQNSYELLSLGMRYWFLTLLIIFCIKLFLLHRNTKKDCIRLQNSFPDRGLVGELVQLSNGAIYPISYEGSIGSSPHNDICVKGINAVAFEFRFDAHRGLILKPCGNSKKSNKKVYLNNGEELILNQESFKVRLFEKQVVHNETTAINPLLFDTAADIFDNEIPSCLKEHQDDPI